MRVMRWSVLVGWALLVLMLIPTTPSASAQSSRPNVILILVDAMRADRLGPYGFTARPTTPNLNRFAGRSVVFQNAISQGAWTVPSVATLFTGMDPQAHQVLRHNKDKRVETDTMSLDHDTIAEQFKTAGYTTAALLKSIVIDTTHGYSQGFDTFEVVNPQQNQADGPSAGELTDRALAWIGEAKTAGKPFFLYLHYMDTHSPYKAPEPYYSKYKGTYTGPIHGGHMQIEDTYVKGGQKPTQADLDRLYGLYDAEVEYWDSQFGRLMAQLVSSGMDPNTIVVVTADHGEAFYEHGQWFHGDLYQENIHIPLIMKVPGASAKKVPNWVQSLDVAPTLSDLAGISKGRYWMGRSLAPVIKGTGPGPTDVVYSEYGDVRTVIDASGLKLISGPNRTELYDLSKDPTEKTNLASSRAADVTRLKAAMEERTNRGRQLAGNFSVSEKMELSPEQIEQLKQLGYLQ